MRRMPPAEVAVRLRSSAPPRLLDVREEWELRICCIEGAVHIPMGQVAQALQTLDPAKETVVICHHGMRSYQVARYLEQNGFEDVINLEGGIAAWASDVDTTMDSY